MRIATISEYSKNDIVQLYQINPSKIDNVSCGIKANFEPLGNKVKESIKAKFSSGCEYFFFVGSMHPRKNIARLMQAFDLFKKKSNSNFKLILSGHILWDDAGIQNTLKALDSGNDIIFTGRISDDDLKNILGAACCLTFVPTFEGFGLPIVEAFQAGVPVICSNSSSMPEVGGEAVIFVNPFDVQEIAEAMTVIQADKILRDKLIQKGFTQKNNFTWQKTAEKLFESILLSTQN